MKIYDINKIWDMKKRITIILLMIISITNLMSQKDSSTVKLHPAWLSLGAGLAWSDVPGTLLDLRIGIHHGIGEKYLISLVSWVNGSLKETPNTIGSIWNLSGLIGIENFKSKSFSIISSTGISYGLGIYRGNYLGYGNLFNLYWSIYEYQEYNYIGLPIDFKFLFNYPGVGCSIDTYVNIHKHPEVGFVLSLDVGARRPSKKTRKI
jgi:hypothetical protein